MRKSFLFKRSEEIILGSLLGDGSLKIHKNYRNARFSFRHSIHQKDYFFWKASQLKDVSGENYYWESEDKDGFGGKKLRYQSMATQELTDLYNLICKNGRLKIQRRWLNLLTPLSLSIWWMDDGSIIGNGRKGVFCTERSKNSCSLSENCLEGRCSYRKNKKNMERKRENLLSFMDSFKRRTEKISKNYSSATENSIDVAEVSDSLQRY